MLRFRRIAAFSAVVCVTASLTGCALLEGPKQSACDALYAQIDEATSQLAGVDVSAQQLDDMLTELESQNPEAFEKLRGGDFSSLLDDSGVDIPALEEATGDPRIGELLTPENLQALDGAGASIMGTIDQIRSVCS